MYNILGFPFVFFLVNGYVARLTVLGCRKQCGYAGAAYLLNLNIL
jgi:hypothetical protein